MREPRADWAAPEAESMYDWRVEVFLSDILYVVRCDGGFGMVKLKIAVSRIWQSKMSWMKLVSAWTRAYIINILIVVMVGPTFTCM
jgi:hypothetical protein